MTKEIHQSSESFHIPPGVLHVPGGRGGINTHVSTEVAANLADSNNTRGHLRAEFFDPDHSRNLFTKRLASGSRVSLYTPSAPYTPDTRMIVAAGPELFVHEASGSDAGEMATTQRIYDLPHDAQVEYWSMALMGLNSLYELTEFEDDPTRYVIFAAENSTVRTSKDKRSSRSIDLPHLHLVRINLDDIELLKEKDASMAHVLREQNILKRIGSRVADVVSHRLTKQTIDTLIDTSENGSNVILRRRSSMPFGYTMRFDGNITGEDFAAVMREHHTAYTEVAEKIYGGLSDKNKSRLIPQPSYRLYINRENTGEFSVTISPEFMSHGGLIEAAGVRLHRDESNPSDFGTIQQKSLDKHVVMAFS